MKRNVFQRVLSIIICLTMVMSYLPDGLLRINAADSAIHTVADPETLTRPETIYGDNTLHAGKITVGKSVSNTGITVNGQNIPLSEENNFLVTISQSAQVMGLTTQSKVPVDVVFVLDTSGSMWVETDMVGPKADGSTGTMNRSEAMIKIVNDTIESLMALNSDNRVGVVAFSGHNLGVYNTAGRADNDAAFELSPLASYSGAAATNHLTYGTGTVNWAGTVPTVHGRDAAGNVSTTERYTIGGATNIQAGIAKGAQMLMNASLTENNTRIPFLIVLSDGAPTVSSSNDNWWEPDQQRNQGNYTYADGNDPIEGNSFLTLLTAAYYKAKVSAHYTQYSGKENNLNVFTIGYGLDTQTTDYEIQMSEMTLNPAAELLSASGNFYQSDIEAAWASYVAGENFTIQVGPPNGYTQSSTITHDGLYYFYNQETTVTYNRYQQSSLTNRQPNDVKYNETWVDVGNSVTYCDNIIEDIIVSGTLTDLAYNDEYYEAENASQLETVFGDLLVLINRKTISSPTKVTTGDHDFDGYINFYDPIGEYMEVKDMKGILADGYFYQGLSFARNLRNYGKQGNEEFDALLVDVITSRLGLSDSVLDIDAFAAQVLASENQAYYNSDTDYDNSIVWWGNAYDSGEEDEQVQVIGFADNDTIDYIVEQKAAGTVPAGADYVVRSYFFYGEAGGANADPDHTYLYFVVQVRRELTAPYNQTVVISAPASLLSVEEVLINETFDDGGNPVYTATVEHQMPARVVYEVGLWDSITPENVDLIVSANYANEAVNGQGSQNYDAATGTYRFFTNDWDRSQSLESHHRGMAKATFDAAEDNPFYTYQQDTLIVDANGDPVAADPSGSIAYYVREYYEWEDNDSDGTYTAVKKTQLIEVDIPADAQLLEKNGQWFIPKGIYTGATLVVNGDDTLKTDNATGTSSIVAHPHRTGNSDNSHYTVILGNNGMLSLVSDPYQPVKTVSIDPVDGGTVITDANGHPIQVGDTLTYTIEVENVLPYPADITVTDVVPMGTAFVAGSAGVGIAPDTNNILTWVLEDVPAGQTQRVSFQVTVLTTAMSLTAVPGSVPNTAQVTIGNSPAISTNTVYNPPYGKTVTDTNGVNIDGEDGYKVGDVLVYHIRVTNGAMDADGNPIAADVTVTDMIPAGTAYVAGSADNGGIYDANTGIITWNLWNMPAGSAKMLSFRVQITADIKANASGTQPADGQIEVTNSATIDVENSYNVTTNTTHNYVEVGDMVITKTVVAEGTAYNDKAFTINLTESTGLLSGTYVLERGTVSETVTFANGKASVTIRHGESLTVKGLPAGSIITVAEDTSRLAGWTAAYNTQSVVITEGAATTVTSVSVTNTYNTVPVTVTLKGQKTLTGIHMDSANTFGFIAVPNANNTEVGDPLTGEVTVDNTGTYQFTFSPKVFTKAGTYTYTIYEINGGLLGVTYDETSYTLVVTVTDNGDGTLSAAATLDGAAFDLANGTVSFTNDYNPVDTQLEFTADKVLEGRDLAAGEFTFQITDGTNIYYGINDAEGNIIFETIHFTKAGTYVYTMQEIAPAVDSSTVSYDRTIHNIEVTVTDVSGQLVATVSVDGAPKSVSGNIVDSGVIFSNSFTPGDVPLVLTAKKVLRVYNAATGTYVEAALEAGQFGFVVKDENGNVVAAGNNDSNGVITFSPFYFSADMLDGVVADANGIKTKTFTYYTVSELAPTVTADPNMLYDATTFQIVVTLTYDTNTGLLSVSVNGDSDGYVDLRSDVEFVNYGNPDSVEIMPVGTKTTSNAPAGATFSFSVINTQTGNEAAVGVGDANGDISFTTMSYSQVGTYTYWIKESNAGNTTNGITYDKTLYLMKVVVSRNSYNRLVAEVTYYSSAVDGSTDVADYTTVVSAPAFHNEYHAAGYINLTASKVLNGRSLRAGEFAFKLVREDNGGEIDGILAADGTITFATMYYSMADFAAGENVAVIEYTMSEVIPTNAALPGVSYDTSEHTVYVRISNNGDGTISAELVRPDGNGGYDVILGTDTGVVFTNTYAAVEGDRIGFRLSKVLEGRDLRAGEFEFGLYLDGELIDVATNDANGIVTFLRSFAATATAGTYELVIKEIPGHAAGVSYSTQEFTLFLKLTDDGHGKLHATLHLTENGQALAEDAEGIVDLTGSYVFRNTYAPHDAIYTPEAEKTLTGRSMIAGEFSFLAQLISRNGAAVADGDVYHGVNNAAGHIVFNAITFTDEGTYIYKISEVQGSTAGMGYDTRNYYLKVVVTDDTHGQLQTDAGYYTDEACNVKATQVVFHNVYTPASVPVQLVGNKTLTGRDLVNGEFSFLVYPQGSTTPVASGSNDANGKIVFSTFSITAQDMMDSEGNLVDSRTFTYIITEANNNLPGVAYAAPVEVTVTVTYNSAAGVFSAEVGYPDGTTAAMFANTYTPSSVTLPVAVFKHLVGKNLLRDEFSFQLINRDDPTEGYSQTNDANGYIYFELTYDAADMVDANGDKVMEKTFVYYLSEETGTDANMTYDGTVYTVTVTVTDDGNGHLNAAAVYTKASEEVEVLEFSNSYTPSAISVDVVGTKTIEDAAGNVLTGAYFPLNGFLFQVYDVNGNPVGNPIVSDVNGKILIEDLSFDAAGEYRFTVRELTTSKPGYTTDPTVWCVHITIAYDADTGLLYEEGEYVHTLLDLHDDGLSMQTEATVEFVNVYEPADVHLVIQGMKQLSGRPLREHEFTFYMVDDATGQRAAESRNHGDGKINFSLTYTQAGTYTYTVYEEIGNVSGVTYTTVTHQVTVEVIDDGTGALKARVGNVTVVGSDTVDLTETVIFVNSYVPNPTRAIVEAWKSLDGKALEAGKYTFELVNSDDPTDRYTATNTADGRVYFDGIDFDAEDMMENGIKVMEKVFTYTLSEIPGNEPGVTYDGSEFTVTVTVRDDGHGNLSATTQYADGNAQSVGLPIFHNTYRAEPVTYTPEVTKIFERNGGEMLTFDFVLSGDGFDTQIKQNNSDGEVTFETLTFYTAGVYSFTVSEQVNDTYENIKWDTNVYTLQITVEDPGDGQLVIRALNIYSDKNRTDLVFRNVHEDLITRKDVFLAAEPAVSIDGEAVQVGDILTYTITYQNYTGLPADVTITDTIPAHTTYVEGSAGADGSFDGTKVSWTFTDVPADDVITVSFQVEVTGADVTVTNQAEVLEGNNAYETNIVVNTVPAPDPEPTDPEPTDPEPTDPEPTDPEPTDPEPTDPEPTDPEPTDPEPTDPEPTDPEPTDPEPTDPEPTDPEPTDPEPTDPEPTDPEPTDPEPTDPEPTDPTVPEPPKTSDMVNLELWLAAMFASGSGLLGTVILGKKKKETEET